MHDLDELAAFAAIMESGSLTRSAKALGLAKSTLSRRISHLEARLGQPLLRRQANRLIPTEAGRLFHGYCQEMLELAERSHEALDELRREIRGELTVEMHNALARSWLAPAMEAFMSRHPSVAMTLRARETPPSSPDTHALCIWLGETPDAGLRSETLGRLTRGLYAHPDYLARHGTPRHPEELTRHAWIDLLGSTQEGLRLFHAREGEFLFHPPRSRLRVNLPVLHVDAIAGGQGLGVLPHWMVEKREAAHPGQLVPCLPDWQPTPLPVTLLYAYGHQPRRVSALIDFLRGTVPSTWRTESRPETCAVD